MIWRNLLFWKPKAFMTLSFKAMKDENMAFQMKFTEEAKNTVNSLPARDAVFFHNCLEGFKRHATVLAAFVEMDESERNDFFAAQMGLDSSQIEKPN